MALPPEQVRVVGEDLQRILDAAERDVRGPFVGGMFVARDREQRLDDLVEEILRLYMRQRVAGGDTRLERLAAKRPREGSAEVLGPHPPQRVGGRGVYARARVAEHQVEDPLLELGRPPLRLPLIRDVEIV
jgi:hypothetical protein